MFSVYLYVTHFLKNLHLKSSLKLPEPTLTAVLHNHNNLVLFSKFRYSTSFGILSLFCVSFLHKLKTLFIQIYRGITLSTWPFTLTKEFIAQIRLPFIQNLRRWGQSKCCRRRRYSLPIKWHHVWCLYYTSQNWKFNPE